MALGTDEGFAEPSVTGESNPFPYTNLFSVPYRRLAKNRMAGLGNKTADFELNHNDIIAAHRGVYTGRQSARNPRLLVAFDPAAGQAYNGATVPANPRGATNTIQDGTGKNVASPGDLTRAMGEAISSAAGLVSVDAGRANDLFSNFLTLSDTDLAAATRYVTRATDANNYISMFRQAAGTLRVERNVAGAVATERDITIPTTTPATGNAFGLRLSGTTAAVFMNGTKLDEWTLNAGAQGLTGTRVGVLLAAGAHVYSPIANFECWSITPVLGV